MTEKQKRFCDEYLIDLNGTQAGIRAGYSEKTAYSIAERLLKNVEIQEYISKRIAEKESELIAKQDEVLKYLTRTMRREELESVVVTLKKHKSYYNDEGKKVIDDSEETELVPIPAKVSDSNKAAELLGKYYTLFTERTQVDGIAQVQILDNIPKGDDSG